MHRAAFAPPLSRSECFPGWFALCQSGRTSQDICQYGKPARARQARRERRRELPNYRVFKESKPLRSNDYFCPASDSFAGAGGFGAPGAGAGVCFGGGAGALGGGTGRAAGRPL
ncbi:MAG: hypothetical protein CR217_01475 [Beijerinckiaceae bacterium]|nr:MAG: hypothetical protein CR217_01475 [Beijerinckiaceae bacterium]